MVRNATIVGAGVIRIELSLGIIAPSAYTDLIVIEVNPLGKLNLFDRSREILCNDNEDGQFITKYTHSTSSIINYKFQFHQN